MPYFGQSMALRRSPGRNSALAMREVASQRKLTLLAVEDSRFAAEALRLICRKIGVRLRRAENLRQADQHLSLYRPDVVLVDLGLPDGSGDVLIRRLKADPWRPKAVLATSGDPAGREPALAAGADGFLYKPLENLSALRAILEDAFPEMDMSLLADPAGRVCEEQTVSPDPLALRDDLARAAAVLQERDDAEGRRYLTGFLGGIARHAHDSVLAEAAAAVGADASGAGEAAQLETLLERRLAGPDAAFIGPMLRRG